MDEFYQQDYINKITVEYTDKRTKVLEDSYVLNQLGFLLTTMSREDELELNKFLEEEGKSVNSEISNDKIDLEESFLFCHSEYENDDILLNSGANGGAITPNNLKRN